MVVCPSAGVKEKREGGVTSSLRVVADAGIIYVLEIGGVGLGTALTSVSERERFAADAIIESP
jgi:hypothetical protein